MKTFATYNPHEEEDYECLTATEDGYALIVWNDDINTFDWMIETLIQVCGHEPEQAEQCAILIHFTGKCAVKKGSYEDLKPMCDAINLREINATLEVTAS